MRRGLSKACFPNGESDVFLLQRFCGPRTDEEEAEEERFPEKVVRKKNAVSLLTLRLARKAAFLPTFRARCLATFLATFLATVLATFRRRFLSTFLARCLATFLATFMATIRISPVLRTPESVCGKHDIATVPVLRSVP